MVVQEEVVVVELAVPEPPELCVHAAGSSSILNEKRDLEYANEREEKYASHQHGKGREK